MNNDAGDESVQNAVFYTGTQAWGYFRGYGSPGCGTPFSPQLASAVGRPSSGAAGDIAVVKFAFKAVSPGDDSIQSLYLGSVARDDRTGSHIVLRNEPAGVRLTMSTYDCGLNTFQTVNIATVSAGAWHTVKMTTQYHEDLSLDVTRYVIDEGTPGEVIVDQVSWMHIWRQCNSLPYTPGASLKFANGSPDTTFFNGFYYDDVSLVVRNSSANNTVVGFFFTSFELTPPADTDADTIPDAIDNCPTTANTDQADTDNDGIGDACEACSDVDVDGVCDNVDNCPTTFNPSQTDADGDSIGDACDTCSLDPANDVDGDGVCGNVDNCPTVFNPSQQNFDGDSQGDACDNDDDNDSVIDANDLCPGTPSGTLVNASGCPLAVTKDQCKNNGWMTLRRANNTTFKNQGDCIQYVNTGK